jgi:hypothetical protein
MMNANKECKSRFLLSNRWAIPYFRSKHQNEMMSQQDDETMRWQDDEMTLITNPSCWGGETMWQQVSRHNCLGGVWGSVALIPGSRSSGTTSGPLALH